MNDSDVHRPVLYIHGFASSGRSGKAQVLRRHMPRVYAPSLSVNPELAIDTLQQFIDLLGRPLLVGSSLGGFYAHYLSAALGLPAVLVNPALQALTLLQRAVGLQRSFADGAEFEFTADHLQALGRYQVAHPAQQQLLLLVELGDELIDQRQSLQLLPNAETVALEGGDHGFSRFEEQMETIRRFAAAAD